MERKLRGKCLVNINRLENGEEVLTLTGVFYPVSFNVEDVKDGGEMWVADIIVEEGGIRFTKNESISISPEDFLEGESQDSSSWKNKDIL